MVMSVKMKPPKGKDRYGIKTLLQEGEWVLNEL